MSRFLRGFGLSGFRSFVGEIQRVAPLEKISFVAGPNNSGKSNLLRFVATRLPNCLMQVATGSGADTLPPLEVPQFAGEKSLRVSVFLDETIPEFLTTRDRILSAAAKHGKPGAGQNLLNSDAFKRGTDGVWVDFSVLDGRGFVPDERQVNALVGDSQLAGFRWTELLNGLTQSNRPSASQNARALLSELGKLAPRQLRVRLVPAFRETGQGGGDDPSPDGKNLVSVLDKLQHPNPVNMHLRERFLAVQNLLRKVLGNEELSLEVESGGAGINIRFEEKFLPLQHFGTGIEELLVIASQACLLDDHLLCIEEPEIHLHPLLQRRLFEFLAEHTTNQYLVSTHSAKLLDFPAAAIVSVRREGGWSVVQQATTSIDRVRLLADLGYHASDLLQSNAIVWVEGPSDRIYLLRWLEFIDPSLHEGTQFSILFYGGRLLSHLSGSDAETEDFIRLRRINQNSVVLLDSDRASDADDLNATKKRIVEEFDRGPGFAWVTAGREIENYIPGPLLESAIRKSHKRVARIGNGTDRFADMTVFVREGSVDFKPIDKVGVARAACSELAEIPDMEDLRNRTEQLVRFIRESN